MPTACPAIELSLFTAMSLNCEKANGNDQKGFEFSLFKPLPQFHE
jgi:hypothetical protein